MIGILDNYIVRIGTRFIYTLRIGREAGESGKPDLYKEISI